MIDRLTNIIWCFSVSNLRLNCELKHILSIVGIPLFQLGSLIFYLQIPFSAAEEMFKNTFQSGFLSILYSLGCVIF